MKSRKKKSSNLVNVPDLRKVLYNLRVTLGLSQEKMSKKMGVSQRAVSYWEQGLRLPKLDNIQEIVKEAKKINFKELKKLEDFEEYLTSRKFRLNIFLDSLMYSELQEVKSELKEIKKILMSK